MKSLQVGNSEHFYGPNGFQQFRVSASLPTFTNVTGPSTSSQAASAAAGSPEPLLQTPVRFLLTCSGTSQLLACDFCTQLYCPHPRATVQYQPPQNNVSALHWCITTSRRIHAFQRLAIPNCQITKQYHPLPAKGTQN